jgi:hypothetical protein
MSGTPLSRPRLSRAGRSPEGGGGTPASPLLNLSTAKSGEQSENVYENKQSRSRGVVKPNQEVKR